MHPRPYRHSLDRTKIPFDTKTFIVGRNRHAVTYLHARMGDGIELRNVPLESRTAQRQITSVAEQVIRKSRLKPGR